MCGCGHVRVCVCLHTTACFVGAQLAVCLCITFDRIVGAGVMRHARVVFICPHIVVLTAVVEYSCCCQLGAITHCQWKG